MQAKSILAGCFESEDSVDFLEYSQMAGEIRDEWADVWHTFDDDVKAAIGCKDGDVFVTHDVSFRSKVENGKVMVKDSDDLDKAKRTLVGAVLGHNRKFLYPAGPDSTYIFIVGFIDFSHKYQKSAQLIRSSVIPVAEKYQSKYIFATMNEDDFSEDIKAWNLEDSTEDTNIVLISGKKVYKYECEDGFSSKVLENFISDFENGEIERFVKSQKAPKKNNGPVKIVTGNTFDKIVMNKKHDVLIEFYAPWCGHCKQLEPKWKKLGKKFEAQKDIVIAKMDTTANDIPSEEFDVSGFPTI